MKLPRLPRKCSVLEAKYSAQQMREYGEKCIKEYIKKRLTLVQVVPPAPRSIIDQMKDVFI